MRKAENLINAGFGNEFEIIEFCKIRTTFIVICKKIQILLIKKGK